MKLPRGLFAMLLVMAIATVSFGSHGSPTNKDPGIEVVSDYSDANVALEAAMSTVWTTTLESGHTVSIVVVYGPMALEVESITIDSPHAFIATLKQAEDNREADMPSYHTGKFMAHVYGADYKSSKSPPEYFS